MVANSCVVLNGFDQTGILDTKMQTKVGKAYSFSHQRSKDSLLFKKSRNFVDTREPPLSPRRFNSSDRINPLNSKPKTFGASKSPRNEFIKASSRGAATPSGGIAKLTPSEKLRSFERKKTPTKSRSITPNRIRSADVSQFDMPSNHFARMRSSEKRPITPKRGRSSDKGRELRSEKRNLFGDRMEHDNMLFERPTEKSPMFKQPFHDEDSDVGIFHPPQTTPKIFEHTEKEERLKRENLQALLDMDQESRAEWHQTDHTIEEARNGALRGLDAIENFRHAYKEADSIDQVSNVVTRDISEMVSDLSCSSAGIRTFKSPRHSGLKEKDSKSRNPPLRNASPGSGQQAYTSTLKYYSAKLNDSFDETPPPQQPKNTSYTASHSPETSSDSDGDRYITISESEDEFDIAARNRLKSKAPLVDLRETEERMKARRDRNRAHEKSKSRNKSRSKSRSRSRSKSQGRSQSQSKSQSRSRSRSNKRDRKTGEKDRKDGVELFGKKRSRPDRLLVPKINKTTSTRASGESRSFVDQAEKRSNAIKDRDEAQGSQSGGQSRKQIDRKLFRKTGGVVDHNMSAAAKSAATRAKQEKKSAVKKLQKTGGAFLGAIAGGKRGTKPSSSSPRNVASDAMFDMLKCQDESNYPESLQSSENPSRQSSDVSNKPMHQTSSTVTERRWFTRKGYKTGTSSEPMYTSDSSSSGVRSSGTSSSRSGRFNQLFCYGKKAIDIEALYHQNHSHLMSSGSVSDSTKSRSSASKESDIVTIDSLKHLMTFDSAIQKERSEIPEAEFGVVELGDEEDAVQTHAILVNKDRIQKQLLSAQPQDDESYENHSNIANSRYILQPISESSPYHGDCEVSRTKQETSKDDSNLQDIEVTLSFADQLRQAREQKHQSEDKDKTWLPRGAYMI